MLDAALSYIAARWSVIPLQSRGKRPLLPSWTEYQSRRATDEEIREWWSRWPGANLGVATGAVSGLVVLDFDGPAAVDFAKRNGVPPTPCVSTGKGWHLYFQHPGQPASNATALGGIKGLDVRGDGGYVVAPPSIHPSGRQYRWIKGRSPGDLPLAPCPTWLLELLARREKAIPAPDGVGWVERLLQGVPEGQRDDACTRLAGHYLGKGLPEPEVLALLRAWNQQNRPPLPDRDLEKCVRSVAARESRKPNKPKGLQSGFRLDGPIYAPPTWSTLVICQDWHDARRQVAAGNAVVVIRPDGRLPPGAEKLVVEAENIETAGFTPEEAQLILWQLFPLYAIASSARSAADTEIMSDGDKATKSKATEPTEIPPPGLAPVTDLAESVFGFCRTWQLEPAKAAILENLFN
ncbi:MAG: bifunctional DNA primase/polymerase [Peptococcaceae bacterium]|nr:bifunctional DNA primase/polymerase [Peptococcaceae bacterium]